MFKYFNPNPLGKLVGDCSVRALCAALNLSWDEAYALMSANGFALADMPSSNEVWGDELYKRGFERIAINTNCPNCFTAEDFCENNPLGLFVLGFGDHVCTVKNGTIYDSWDSSRKVPQYVWRY